MKLNRRDLVRIFFRSFLIQGLWTVQRAQNLGYLYSLWPVFRRLYPKREDRASRPGRTPGF
ncbi:MAG: PTS system mannose/fructose/sorbose family transporter subunit IID [Elusimicrobia bacterium]|nr:PTS system mannose/fructose/sorbose family transporter subunit IID [Elusimicrobiota bacterium]